MEESSICAICERLIDRPDVATNEEVEVIYDMATIAVSAQSGCRICILIWDRLCSLDGSITDNKVIRGIMCFWDPTYGHNRHGNEEGDPVHLYFGLGDGSGWQYFESAFLKIFLQRKAHSGGRQEMEIRKGRDIFDRSSVSISTRVQGTNTGDAPCMDLVKCWLQRCLSEHKHCNSGHNMATTMPTRLIDATDPTHPYLVVIGHETAHGERVKYATVSHKWRQESMPKLLLANFEALQQGIDPARLPSTFQDAIALAKRLDIPYVWIDSLCIVQDDNEDWQRESSKMGDVYGNAMINFGASAAATRPCGLFIDRDPRLASAVPVTVRRMDYEAGFYGYTERMGDDVLNHEQIFYRGWIMQERLLSQRSIYYGQQLVWECSELVACEAFPEGPPCPRYSSPWGRAGYPFRMQNLLLENLPEDMRDDPKDVKPLLYRKWLYVTERFTECKLSFEDDSLPAMSGLAKRFGEALQDEYVAGLWKSSLLPGLLWQVEPELDLSENPWVYPKKYRAPSWSWASVTVATFNRRCHDSRNMRYYAKVKHVSIELAGLDLTGQVSGGYLVLQAFVKPDHQSKPWENGRGVCRKLDYYDYGLTEHEASHVHIIICYNMLDISRGDSADDVSTEGAIHGIIVEPIKDRPDTYRRIGFFDHPWGPGRLGDPHSWPEPEDFEAGGFQKRTLTII